MDRRPRGAAIVAIALGMFSARPAMAIPVFAHQYDVTCAKCHSVIPHLNAFGAAFAASGDRIPGVTPGPAFPLAAKINMLLSSEDQGSGVNGAGLGKSIVDEVEVFTTGAIGARGAYFVEQYAVDGGEHGLLRDAWIDDRVSPWDARVPVSVQAGSFTLPLPVDPETFRDTYQDYTVYTQTVGADPFNFFDPKIGGRVGIGDPLRGPSLQLFAGPGHDRQSGVPTTGTDLMEFAQFVAGPLAPSVYHYAGHREVADGVFDSFERTGFGLTYGQWSRFSSEAVLQTGWDSDCVVALRAGCASSGGFEQLRYAFNRRLFSEVRYEGTDDPTNGLTRDAAILLGFGPSEHSRITVEDVIRHAPAMTNTLNIQLTDAQ
jgi:hypothetical protein